MVNEDEFDVFFDRLRHFVHVALVFFRQEDLLDACPVSGDDFFLDAPYGRTVPRNVISPVMATSWRTALPVRADVMAVAW